VVTSETKYKRTFLENNLGAYIKYIGAYSFRKMEHILKTLEYTFGKVFDVIVI